MPRFPKKEAEIEALAMDLVRGLWTSTIFPDPPVLPMSSALYRWIRQVRILSNTMAKTAERPPTICCDGSKQTAKKAHGQKP